MTSLVLGIAGAVIGSFTPIGPQLGFAIGSTIGGIIDPPPGPPDTTATGPRLDDLKVSSASYGRPIPIIYGRRRTATTIIWAADIEEHRNDLTADQDTAGGKFGKGGDKKDVPTHTQTTFTYSADFAVSCCEGPVIDVLRIWANNELIMDKTTDKTPPFGSKFVGRITTYLGTETQEIDPTFEADVGVGNANANRGMCYLVFNDLPLEDFGNRIPQIAVEVATATSASLPIKTISPDIINTGVDNGVWNISRTAFISVSNPGPPVASRIDFLQQDVVFQKTLDLDGVNSGGPMDGAFMDILGNIYIVVPKGSSSSALLAYSGETFELVARSHESSFDGKAISHFTICGPIRDQRICTVGPSGTLSGARINMFRTTPSADLFATEDGGAGDIPLLVRISTFDMEDIFPQDEGSYDVLSDGGITRDADGFVWLVCTDTVGNTTYITKIDPGSGMPITQFKIKDGDADQLTNFATGDVNTTDDEITIAAHGFITQDGPWHFTTSGTLPAGLSVGTDYFLIRTGLNDFQVAASVLDALAGTQIDLTDVGSGTHTLNHGFQGHGDIGRGLVTWDSQTNSLIWVEIRGGLGNDDVLRSFNIDFGLEGTIKKQIRQNVDTTGDNITQFNNAPINGRLWVRSGTGGRFELRTDTMRLERSVSTADWQSGTFSAFAYDPLNNALIETLVTNGDLSWHFLDRATGTTVTLRSIVEDVCFRTGFNVANDIDATDLTDTVIGYAITNRMAARSALEPLAQLYFFDGIESDWKIKFVKRGNASVLDIAEGKLAAREGGADPSSARRIEATRQQELELLQRIDLLYQDLTFDYQTNVQHAKRVDEAVDTLRAVSLEIPLVIDNSEARQRCEIMLYADWFERNTFKISVGPEFLGLDVGDLISTTVDSIPYVIRIKGTQLGAGFIIRIEGAGMPGITAAEAEAAENALYAVTSAAGETAQGHKDQVVKIIVPSKFAVMDTNLILDQHDVLGLYSAAGAAGDFAWQGARMIRSENGEQFDTFDTIPSSRNAQIGFATGVLAAPVTSEWTWDLVSTVNVRMFRGTLASSTRSLVLNGANAILIGDEYIQFVTATLESDGTYTLSELLRARRGTDPFMSTHVAGDRVVLLTPTTIQRVSLEAAELDTTRFYKALTIGGNPLEGFVKSITFVGNAQKPYTVQQVAGTIDSPATDDWTITWDRRTRIGGPWNDGQDVPLGEAIENYEIDVMADGTANAAVKRTITDTATGNGTVITPATPDAVYDAADQVTDFGVEQTTLFLRIFQMSEAVGRGHVRAVTIVE